MNLNLQAIPNAKWLALGMAFTLGMTFMMPTDMPSQVGAYAAVGMVVARTFLMFHNPQDQPVATTSRSACRFWR